MQKEQRRTNIKSIVFLQLIIILYTFSTVFNNIASGYPFLSGMFILFVGLAVLVLASYALLWQQALKRFDLNVAYANRQLAIIWGLVWSAIIFKEGITTANLIGTAIIVVGVVLVNIDAE